MLYLVTLLSFLLCLAATPVVRRIAIDKGWIAYPSAERWHKKPTALLGGIAIYFGIAAPFFLIADFSTVLPHFFRTSDSVQLPSLSAVIWLGMTFIFVIGLFDDFLHRRLFVRNGLHLFDASARHPLPVRRTNHLWLGRHPRLLHTFQLGNRPISGLWL